VELTSYLKFAVALVFVLALIGVLATVARRLGLAPRVIINRGKRRLAIVEVLAIDARRRLVLVRRDEVEHLVLLGTTHDTVVEADIAPPPGVGGSGSGSDSGSGAGSAATTR
jgi:flagellar protein FliO/FliZ